MKRSALARVLLARLLGGLLSKRSPFGLLSYVVTLRGRFVFDVFTLNFTAEMVVE